MELPVSGSLCILGVERMTPKAEKVSYSSFSSTSGSRFPMKMLAPTSRFFWWAEALFTLTLEVRQVMGGQEMLRGLNDKDV